MRSVLVIDDDTYMCNLLKEYLQRNGYMATAANNGRLGMKLFTRQEYDVVLCDFRLPDCDGTKILKFIKSVDHDIPVIIMTAYSDIKTAVTLIKAGAFDYVTKPLQPEEILRLVNRACAERTGNNRNSTPDISFPDHFITGKSTRIREVMDHVRTVAPTDVAVLIEGETGSGKEFIARAIHHYSNRNDKPFIAVDCGAIPTDLANSELFGHVKGAFTGAISDKTGYYEQADGGTLFLDEVGNLSSENQLKLLRTLQDGIIHKLGDDKAVKVDVRIISASNASLLEKTRSYEFRNDLYHRLNVFRIQLPALRQRKEDLMEFTRFFIDRANHEFGRYVSEIDNESKEFFMNYEWPGNIRELQNVIYRAVLLARSHVITPDLLPDELKIGFLQLHPSTDIRNDIYEIPELKEATLITEKEIISNALVKFNYNKSKAARALNIDRKTLYNKIKLYKIDIRK